MLVLGSGASLLLAIALAVPVAAAAGLLGVVTVAKVRAATPRRRRGGGGGVRARGGAEGLVGGVGVVRRPLDPTGQIALDGALWRARRSWADEDEPPPAEG